MNNYLIMLKKSKLVVIILIGTIAFSFILSVTLDIGLAFLSFILFISVAIFQKSFHYGLIFFLGVILIFPSISFFNGNITLQEIFISIIALLGSANLILEGYKFKFLPLFYYWVGLIILTGLILISQNKYIWEIIYRLNFEYFIIIIVYPIIIILFQYFFQTTKRLERFFLLIILAGFIQSLMNIIFATNNLFIVENILLQKEALIVLIMVTAPTTLGMWLTQKNSLTTLKFLWLNKKKKNIYKFVDSILDNKHVEASKSIINLKKTRINRQNLLLFIFGVQILALIFTLSFIPLIIIGLGIFIMGVLLRNRNIILIVLSLLLLASIILPNIGMISNIQLKQEFIELFYNIKKFYSLQILWQGTFGQQLQQISNAYLFIFSKVGLIGLFIFILGLIQYFKEIRNTYLKSDEFERIWIVVILVIFIEFVILAMNSKAFFSWPAGLLFWILYGTLQNLKKSKKEYKLIESVIGN